MLVYGGISQNEEVLGDSYLFNVEKQIWKQLSGTTDPVCCHALVNITQGNLSKDQDIIPYEQVFSFGGKDREGNSTNILRKLVYCTSNNSPSTWEVITPNGIVPPPCHNHTLEYLKKL